jgi:hypothetical protein
MKKETDMKKETGMKMVLAGLLSLVLTTAASAANLGSAGSLETSGVDEADRHRAGKVQWKEIVGVITALNLDNPVNDINSGTFAWSARRGFAEVDLKTGTTTFEVLGLSINGTVFSGTPGPITAVTGTLVCNAGEATEAVLDTAEVALSAQGDAQFYDNIGSVPSPCANLLSPVRIASPAGAAGRVDRNRGRPNRRQLTVLVESW